MESLLKDILDELAKNELVDERSMRRIINLHNRGQGPGDRRFSKTSLLSWVCEIQRENPRRWESFGIDPDMQARLMRSLRLKPGRTASGVATISLLTKPWPCSSDCLYCPNDIRMPKSYLHLEPACQRAERNFFDPYLQVTSRLKALVEMAHVTDKIELIVLGGTWSDYPSEYRVWFVEEMFRALNDFGLDDGQAVDRRHLYESLGISSDEKAVEARSRETQRLINCGELSYPQAWKKLYGPASPWDKLERLQKTSREDLAGQQLKNETARHRVVGLVFETRPDAITPELLEEMRVLGCTKVQMGIQSLNQNVLNLNERGCTVQCVREAIELVRAYGFKIHVHMMLNLYGSSPQGDLADFEELTTCPSLMPDEVKLYPCVLVENSRLGKVWDSGRWRPYNEEQLIGLLADEVRITPPYMRVSRMIRDISAEDIVAGNKKGNLRQYVDRQLAGDDIQEIRSREIGHEKVSLDELEIKDHCYRTSIGEEHFLQWVTHDGRIAAFLRLFLPGDGLEGKIGQALPYGKDEAMIRELHVYGEVAAITDESNEAGSSDGRGAQHAGLGKALVDRACKIARYQGYLAVNVISAVGTRGYYRSLGFEDVGLYQQKALVQEG